MLRSFKINRRCLSIDERVSTLLSRTSEFANGAIEGNFISSVLKAGGIAGDPLCGFRLGRRYFLFRLLQFDDSDPLGVDVEYNITWGNIAECFQGEEVAAIIAAEAAILGVPPLIEFELGGIDFLCVDDEILGACCVFRIIQQGRIAVRHQIYTFVAHEPEAWLCGLFIAVERRVLWRCLAMRDQAIKAGAIKVQFHVGVLFRPAGLLATPGGVSGRPGALAVGTGRELPDFGRYNDGARPFPVVALSD